MSESTLLGFYDLRGLVSEAVDRLENHKRRIRKAYNKFTEGNTEITIVSLAEEAGIDRHTIYNTEELLKFVKDLVNEKKEQLKVEDFQFKNETKDSR
ncbi:MAG: hypothetical protein ACFFCZ_17520 [Promethearchaeota archaeon]